MSRIMVGTLIAAAGMIAFCPSVSAQAPGQKQPPAQKKENEPAPVSIRFRNDTKLTVVLQGVSIVKGMQRRGAPVLIKEGKAGFESNIAPGTRLITIFDYNHPSRPLLQNFPLRVPPGGDLQVLIRTDPNNPQRIILTPDQP